jgi:hypothetical protein
MSFDEALWSGKPGVEIWDATIESAGARASQVE